LLDEGDFALDAEVVGCLFEAVGGDPGFDDLDDRLRLARAARH